MFSLCFPKPNIHYHALLATTTSSLSISWLVPGAVCTVLGAYIHCHRLLALISSPFGANETISVFVNISGCVFEYTDGVWIPAISGLLKPPLLVHAVGTVCIRFKAPFFTEKAGEEANPQAKQRAACVGSKATCAFIIVSKFSPIGVPAPCYTSEDAEPGAEHKYTCSFICTCVLRHGKHW